MAENPHNPVLAAAHTQLEALEAELTSLETAHRAATAELRENIIQLRRVIALLAPRSRRRAPQPGDVARLRRPGEPQRRDIVTPVLNYLHAHGHTTPDTAISSRELARALNMNKIGAAISTMIRSGRLAGSMDALYLPAQDDDESDDGSDD